MKKVIFTAAAVFAFGFANAQKTQFGIIAGVDFASANVTSYGGNFTISETNFYVGVFFDIAAKEKFHIQPELSILLVDGSNIQLQFPVLAKFYVTKNLSLLAGPDMWVDLYMPKNVVGLGIDLGGVYDLDKNFSIEAKYNLGLTNTFNYKSIGFSSKPNGLFVGVGYKF